MNESDNCIFCKIIAGEVPCEKIYEDKHTFAFLTNRPEGPDHTLVIPKQHYRNILDCPPDVLNHVMGTVQKLSKELIAKHGWARIVQNNEKPVQEVFHLHFHIIPKGIPGQK